MTDEACEGADLHYASFYRGAHRIFTPAVMARGRALLDQAKAAAQGDTEAEARVAYLDSGLRNAELTLATQQAFLRNREAGDFEGFAKALAELDEYRAGSKVTWWQTWRIWRGPRAGSGTGASSG